MATERTGHEVCKPSDLILRPPELGDAAPICSAVKASLPELSKWLPWATDSYNEESAVLWINRTFDELYPIVAAEPDGTIVGTCCINHHDPLNKRANLGYWIRSDRTGRGYATHAARYVAQYALQSGLHRIEIIMSTQNAASRRVAERVGAHYEGIARNRILIFNKPHDAHVFSITKP